MAVKGSLTWNSYTDIVISYQMKAVSLFMLISRLKQTDFLLISFVAFLERLLHLFKDAIFAVVKEHD